MFDLITGNKRVVQVVLAIIILPFAFFGVDSYFRGSSDAQQLASINGDPITANEYGQVLRRAQSSMQQQMKDNPQLQDYFSSIDFKRSILEDMIQRKLITSFAKRSGIVISDEAVRGEILSIEAFHDEDGTFANDRYVTLLRAQNLNPERFENEIKQAMILEKIENVVLEDSFVSKNALVRLETIRKQVRAVSQHILDPKDFIGEAVVTDADIQKFYDENQNEFLMPEKVKVEYVLLTPEVLAGVISISDQELSEVYSNRLADFTMPEQRKVSHILVTEGDNPSKAKIKIEKLLEMVKEDPSKFTQVARDASEDPGSAEVGGDLGFFEKGVMPKTFDEKAFSLSKGEISGIVKTEYGYHILKVDDIQASVVTPFEDVRQDLYDEVRKDRLYEEYGFASEEFGDLVYSQDDSLQPVADRFNLTVFKSEWFTERGGSGNPILDNPSFLEAVFSNSSIEDRRNIEAIEIDDSQLLSARVIEHETQNTVKLSEVEGEIRTFLMTDIARKAAKKNGEILLAELRNGETSDISWSQSEKVSILDRKGLHPEGLRAVFSASSKNLPSYVGLEAENGKYVIYQIQDVNDKDVRESDIGDKARAELNNLAGQEYFKAFLSTLRDNSEVYVNEDFFTETYGQ